MRQLGARLPETPRTEAPRTEVPQQSRQPKPRFEELDAEPLDVDQIREHIQEQFRVEPRSRVEPRPRFDQRPERGIERIEPRPRFDQTPERGMDRVESRPRFDQTPERAIEAVPRQAGIPWGLLEPKPEKTHRFPFLTIAVPAVAALLALGALLWSGSMRDRLRQQDAAMNALQAQNQKMADTLEEMSVEQKASSALSASSASPSETTPPAKPAAQGRNASGTTTSSTTPAPKTSAPAASQEDVPARKADTSRAVESTEAASPAPQPPVKQEAKPEVKAESAPPQTVTPPKTNQDTASARKAAADAEIARNAKPVETARAPELVPPYPTNYKPLGATNVQPAGSQAQAAGVYHQPFPVGGAPRTATAAPATTPAQRNSYAQPPAAAPRTTSPPASPAAAEPADTSAGGSYGSALAQNVETVQGLQRHSTVPLQEFHVHEGMLTKVTPALGLSVRHPDAGHGTYALVIDGNGGPYELRGQVNNPLVFTDNTTHREYELVVLRIADKQVYGYVRAMR